MAGKRSGKGGKQQDEGANVSLTVLRWSVQVNIGSPQQIQYRCWNIVIFIGGLIMHIDVYLYIPTVPELLTVKKAIDENLRRLKDDFG
jgi:hypothetical protein